MAKKKEQWIKQPVPFDQKERPLKGSKQIVGPILEDPKTGKSYLGVYIRDFDTNSIKWIFRPQIKREKGTTAEKPKTLRLPSRRTLRITPKRPKLSK